ncbi:PepSY-like domain-containing protein [Flavobacterium sp.]|uniref:PepSY-like domain-containing protein n=1 Tax=Flavobacterium sp. TaxID=239 RepID=UPI001B7C7859|nr:PepSY-like domain-containing protein [Flavobacterium sp.]MBP6181261.1 PepSY-like domain-containing protein [Flavobacterium sp.]
MKIQQKTLIAFAFSVIMFSCSNDEPVSSSPATSAVASTYEVVAASVLPTTITSYITSKYAGSTTTQVNLNSNGTYVVYVTLPAGTTTLKSSNSAKTANLSAKLNFTAKGAFESAKIETQVAVADLLPAITTYITTNYVGATIISAHLESEGDFDVFITTADGNKMKIKFNVAGAFVSVKIFKASGNHKHKHDTNQIPVAIADLITNIKAYITTNYSGATITSAHKESDNTFDVLITTATGAHLNLNFSAAGEFLSVSSNGSNHSNRETQVAVADLLANITTYITTNYVGATITSAHKDWNGGFEVYLTTAAGVRLELNFTGTGEFVVGSDSKNNHSGSMVSVIVTDLIATIKEYITTNYAGASIKEAHLESDGSYDVTIITANGTKLKLNFTATGVFVSITNS